MKNKKIQGFDLERSIIHTLLLKSSLLRDMGLFRGKTGLAIFFVHYYKFTNEVLYEDVAEELIAEIEEGLYNNLPIAFESGLSGIGWGLDYLVRQGFVEGDCKEICEEIDCKIMQIDPRRITDYSLSKGIGGILLYVLDHCKIVLEQCNEIPFDDCYLGDLYAACIDLRSLKDVSEETLCLANTYIAFHLDKKPVPDGMWDICKIVQGIADVNERQFSDYPLGLHNGLAGILFEKCCIKDQRNHEGNLHY